ncbi:MAG TPA: plastocyanin/azurin family copper-binding protein [Longimicrobiaceae bacterium]|nr:plastocyanin/azurin family copper-binding protein [Longimicrobiaceae bacterium]
MPTIGRTVLAGLLLTLPAASGAAAEPPPRAETHVVKMVQEGSAYRFQPASLTVRAGDRVRFVMVSGGPHNVAFDAERIPDAAERALSAGMPDRISPLAGAILTEAGASYTVSFDGVPPGSYPFFCMPHVSMGMRGTVTVR